MAGDDFLDDFVGFEKPKGYRKTLGLVVGVKPKTSEQYDAETPNDLPAVLAETVLFEELEG